MYSQIINETKRDKNTYQIKSFQSFSGSMFSIKSFEILSFPEHYFLLFKFPLVLNIKIMQEDFCQIFNSTL